jgi:hypothetical protein
MSKKTYGGKTFTDASLDATIRFRAEQMLRESLAAQIKIGLIRTGEPLDPKALRSQLDDCMRAAVYALKWEHANPGEKWSPTYTASNLGVGLNEQRYRQYASPTRAELG